MKSGESEALPCASFEDAAQTAIQAERSIAYSCCTVLRSMTYIEQEHSLLSLVFKPATPRPRWAGARVSGAVREATVPPEPHTRWDAKHDHEYEWFVSGSVCL